MINSKAAPSFLRSAFTRLALYPPNPTGDHHALREGAKLGIIVATVTWLWLALIDVTSGDAFRTPTMLGGIVAFTLVHYVLNMVYAVSVVSLIHSATRHPTLILVALIGFTMVEIGFIMLTAALSYFLGGIAWVSIFGGSLIGAAIAFQLLALKHPLRALLRQAEEER